MNIDHYIKDVANFPKKGIIFKDISPLLANPKAFAYVVDNIASKYSSGSIDKIVGLDARGFIFGAAVAYKMGVPFVMVRKPGKLPDQCISVDYQLEYGQNTFEIHENSIQKNDKILIVDDLLATGGSVKAVTQLIRELEATVIALECVIELSFLNARNNLDIQVNTQTAYD
ncbi:adenine phosphoribosyltransferase [Candidatus Thioglobus sp.]|jgi:adenine phosphoribosyltransferase|uniref:adenine phosphoribosyltransferase n=1 Tax=Candidatus Thioglobus sp. TaxID=2026721 RepID=UPI001DB11589|nr:adenine phosphoribosyltransferase [Candidatus Thioglobus sp.]MBT3277690.1 adenine phosphoribosyltransferase [Candidatus Thioglobus sp.]MBT3447289.1 adenine phosphoribosyltransferase [Candidatus Thioglobus sp.]MBT3744930.1 adenine phosphoribosyltransferase [Candidatus Thioglobus sp.]MBT4001419.1 adenine phosphoribosyltransferase [Candidatus Thioglobus sp.]MBT4182276.1 adenine phosphoribosyltransferase [Candidatus Thioglobus sp.]